MGAGAMQSQPDNTGMHSQHAQMTKKTGKMACEDCAVNFNLFKRKKVCSDCGKLHCSSCLGKGPATGGRCRLCWCFVSGSFSRADLMGYAVRDLRRFLNRRRVATDKCTEKRDLVELVLQLTPGGQRGQQATAEHAQHLLRLQENVRQSQSTSRHHGEVIVIEDLEEDDAPHEDEPVGVEVHRHHSVETAHDDRRPDDREHSTSQKAALKPGGRQPGEQDETNIEDLSIRQLKDILATNFVAYKGCCEKWELVDRVRRVRHSNKLNKEQADKLANTDAADCGGAVASDPSDVCKICMDAIIDCVLLDCGHMVTCIACGRRMSECPICRQYVVRVVHTFKA